MTSHISRTGKGKFIAFRVEADLALAIQQIARVLNISQSHLIRLTMHELAQRLEVLPPVDAVVREQGEKLFETSYSWPYKRE